MKKIVWQKLGKKQIEQERVVDLEANRKTLAFVREKMIVTLEDVRKAFRITTNCARNRLYRLKRSGFLSSRVNGNSKVYFPTKLGFGKMPREKGSRKKQEVKIVEKPVEVIKKEKETDRIYPVRRI